MEEFLKPFKALSDETRLRMLNILTEQECCVCEVMQVLGISQTRASRNLKILEEAGFLQARRTGLGFIIRSTVIRLKISRRPWRK